MKTQCNAPKSKTDTTHQCPNTARNGGQYCGVHRACKTVFNSSTASTTTFTQHLDTNLKPNVSNNNTSTRAKNKRSSNRRTRLRTISGNSSDNVNSDDNGVKFSTNNGTPRKRTKTRQTPSPSQLSSSTASPYALLELSKLNIPMFATKPPLLKHGDILTPEFAIRPGVTNRYLDNLLASDPGLATRSISALGLNKYKYMTSPHGIFTPTDRILRFIQRIRGFYNSTHACTAIKTIQRTWRRTKYRSIAHNRGPAWFEPMTICSNTSDFYTCQDLNEIPPRMLFTYRVPSIHTLTSHTHITQNTPIYGFHLHSFLELINTAVTSENRQTHSHPVVLNPFDRSPIPNEAIERAQKYDMIIRHWCDIDEQPYINEIAAAKKASLDDLPPSKRAEMHIISIFQKIDLLGYHTNINWLAGKSIESLIAFITALNMNWTHRLGLTENIRREILPAPWNALMSQLTSNHVMEEITLALGSFGPAIYLPGHGNNNNNNNTGNLSNSIIGGASNNNETNGVNYILMIREEIKYKLLKRILDCLDAMMTYSTSDDAKNTACIVILYSLAYINPFEVNDSNPWMD